jgi:hypothetical protein
MKPENPRLLRSDKSDPFLAAALSSIAALGNRTPAGRLIEEVDCLTTQPLRWFRDHIHWPSGMGSHGIPVEVSISLKNPSQPSFHILSDPQDHRFLLAGNWASYVRAGARLTGLSEARVALLMAQHLDVNPPNTRTPLYHGLRYGRKGRHSSLYFSTVSWPKELTRQRFPESAGIPELQREGPNAPWVHGAGYDFDETGSLYRTKLYAWLDRDSPLQQLCDSVGDAPGVTSAQRLLDHLKKVRRIDTPQESTLLQFSLPLGSRQSWTRKLYLHAPKWQFDNPAGLGDLVRYVARQWGVDGSKLIEVLTIFSSHRVPLLPSGIGFGLSGPVPTDASFYFAPVVGLSSSAPTRARLRSIYRKSTRAILQQAKRGWPDLPPRERTVAISRIRLALAGQPALRRELAELDAAKAGAGQQDRSDPICLVRDALTCLRLGIPGDSAGAVPFDRAIGDGRRCDDSPSELTALRLLVALESNCASDSEVLSAVESLMRKERWGGGWIGPGDELDVTIVVLEALMKASVTRPSLRPRLAPALMRTIYWLRALPVSREAARVALWIKGNQLTGDTRSGFSVDRGLAFLADSQQKDGTWLPSPFESASGDCAWLDPHGWLATALVSEILAGFA